MTKTSEIDAFLLVNGFRASAMVRAAAQLRLPDLLAAGPRTAEDLAAEVGVQPGPLYRLLRGLAALGVFSDSGDGTFDLTEVGQHFEDRAGSLRAVALVLPEQSGPSFREIRYSLETGRPGYEKAHGQSRWEHISADPKAVAEFQEFMIATSERIVPNLLRAYDFSSLRVIADIGGGHGGLLAGILSAHSRLSGVLFDLPAAVADAHHYLAMKGVLDRCRLVPGDFFSAVPGGADAYLLKFILHDWPDAECGRILQRCRAAMTPEARLLIVERLLPERATLEGVRVLMADMEMMMAVGGQERTVARFEQLLDDASFRLERTEDISADLNLLVTRPV